MTGAPTDLELAVVRHGEARSRALTDAARELTGQGESEARDAGRLLRERWGAPDLVLHSTAVRTTQTWAQMATQLEPVAEDAVWPCREVYEAGVPDLLRALADAPSDARRVLLVGHAPGVPALVGHLTGDWPEGWATGQVGLLGLRGDLTWATLHEGCAERLR